MYKTKILQESARMNELDFSKISKALQTSYQAIINDSSNAPHLVSQLNESQEEYLKALSHATDVDKEFLRYTNLS
jgi:hypothetical protein